MKKYVIIILFVISPTIFSQDFIDISYFPAIDWEAETYQLDILSQKLENEIFVTTNHRKYIINVFNDFYIENQKVYDTINGTIPINTDIKYEYSHNGNLRKMSFYDFKGNLKKENTYNYDEENTLVSEIEYDENGENEGEESIKIIYYQGKCKPEYISDLIVDTDIENLDEVFYCSTKETTKIISNYTFSVVNVSKNYTFVKKINLKGNKDSPISRFYTFKYDDNENETSVDVTRNNKTKRYKTNKYNKQGDLIYTKSGFSELYYSYKYDDFGNWTEKIETSKIKSKRRIFIRSFKH